MQQYILIAIIVSVLLIALGVFIYFHKKSKAETFTLPTSLSAVCQVSTLQGFPNPSIVQPNPNGVSGAKNIKTGPDPGKNGAVFGVGSSQSFVVPTGNMYWVDTIAIKVINTPSLLWNGSDISKNMFDYNAQSIGEIAGLGTGQYDWQSLVTNWTPTGGMPNLPVMSAYYSKISSIPSLQNYFNFPPPEVSNLMQNNPPYTNPDYVVAKTDSLAGGWSQTQSQIFTLSPDTKYIISDVTGYVDIGFVSNNTFMPITLRGFLGVNSDNVSFYKIEPMFIDPSTYSIQINQTASSLYNIYDLQSVNGGGAYSWYISSVSFESYKSPSNPPINYPLVNPYVVGDVNQNPYAVSYGALIPISSTCVAPVQSSTNINTPIITEYVAPTTLGYYISGETVNIPSTTALSSNQFTIPAVSFYTVTSISIQLQGVGTTIGDGDLQFSFVDVNNSANVISLYSYFLSGPDGHNTYTFMVTSQSTPVGSTTITPSTVAQTAVIPPGTYTINVTSTNTYQVSVWGTPPCSNLQSRGYLTSMYNGVPPTMDMLYGQTITNEGFMIFINSQNWTCTDPAFTVSNSPNIETGMLSILNSGANDNRYQYFHPQGNNSVNGVFSSGSFNAQKSQFVVSGLFLPHMNFYDGSTLLNATALIAKYVNQAEINFYQSGSYGNPVNMNGINFNNFSVYPHRIITPAGVFFLASDLTTYNHTPTGLTIGFNSGGSYYCALQVAQREQAGTTQSSVTTINRYIKNGIGVPVGLIGTWQ